MKNEIKTVLIHAALDSLLLLSLVFVLYGLIVGIDAFVSVGG